MGGDVLGRFGAPARHPAFWVSLWAATVAAELVVLVSIALADEPVPGYRAIFRLSGGLFVVCGLIAWRRRPDSRSGLLMVLAGFGLLIEPLFAPLPPSPLRTVGDLFEDAWGIPVAALLLTFLSSGRLRSRTDRILVGAFVVQLGLEFVRHLFLERDGNFLLVHANPGIADAIVVVTGLLVSVALLAVAGVICVRWKRASAPRRRAMFPSVAGLASLLFFAIVQQAAPTVLVAWLAVCTLLALPVAFLFGLLRSRLARAGVPELFRALRTARGAELQVALAHTLGDPGLVLAYPAPGRSGYVDADGAGVVLDRGRAVAPIERNGGEVAALVYDAALDADPELVRAAQTAAAIAVENEQMRVASKAQIAELRASRQRIVAAGDAERRRLERNLHDGAQQRLVGVFLQLRLLQEDIRSDPARAEQLATTASDELARSLAELRELARGIHPAVLDAGLAAALRSLGARSTVATAVSCDSCEHVPRDVELALYFVACEALANVGRYSHASTASIRLARVHGGVAIEIADDGVGGADLAAGRGLRGLSDRVEALDGRLLVTSPAGAGTVVSAEVPCGS